MRFNLLVVSGAALAASLTTAVAQRPQPQVLAPVQVTVPLTYTEPGSSTSSVVYAPATVTPVIYPPVNKGVPVTLGAEVSYDVSNYGKSANGLINSLPQSQVGRGDYRIRGLGIYADLDFSKHFGVELEGKFFRNQIREDYAAAGIKYQYALGPVTPFAKVLVGGGDFTGLQDARTVNFNKSFYGAHAVTLVGAGLEYQVVGPLKLRAQAEYTQWYAFPRNTVLAPIQYGLGVNYTFNRLRFKL